MNLKNNYYDVAAYIWPAYTGNEKRSMQFWPEGMGEWQTVKSAVAKFSGHNWPRRPLWGYVNEADPYIMEMQINAAIDYGVNVFIYDWYWYDRRPFLENCLNDGFLKAKNRNEMKFYLMWANHDATPLWDKRISDTCDEIIWNGAVDRKEFEIIVNRIIEKYFSQPEYYKIDGKPVFMIYDLNNLLKGLGGVSKTGEALDYFRKKTMEAGFPGLHLQATITGYNITDISGVDKERGFTTKDIINALGFDSMSHYQFIHFTNVDRDYQDVLADVLVEWEKIDREYSIPYFPHISIGWDNNPRYQKRTGNILRNNTPDNFKKGLQFAKEYVNNHPKQVPLITINSWNEWTESSYLEPDNQNGYAYLQAIKDIFGNA